MHTKLIIHCARKSPLTLKSSEASKMKKFSTLITYNCGCEAIKHYEAEDYINIETSIIEEQELWKEINCLHHDKERKQIIEQIVYAALEKSGLTVYDDKIYREKINGND